MTYYDRHKHQILCLIQKFTHDFQNNNALEVKETPIEHIMVLSIGGLNNNGNYIYYAKNFILKQNTKIRSGTKVCTTLRHKFTSFFRK